MNIRLMLENVTRIKTGIRISVGESVKFLENIISAICNSENGKTL